MNYRLITLLFLFLSFLSFAQEKLNYQKPPTAILELVNSPLAPAVRIDSKGENVILLYRDAYKSIAELSEAELRLGGLRINPKTNIGSRTTYYNKLEVKKASEKNARPVTGLPTNPRLSNFTISPDEKFMALLNTSENQVHLWLVDIEKGTARQLSSEIVNANMGDAINWFKDGSALLLKTIPQSRKELINISEAIPEGPTITVSDGEKAQNRTYQDLLSSPNDEYNFEQLAQSEIKKVTMDGTVSKFLPVNMYDDIDFSPNGEFVMVSIIKKPFSYIVPYNRFPFQTSI